MSEPSAAAMRAATAVYNQLDGILTTGRLKRAARIIDEATGLPKLAAQLSSAITGTARECATTRRNRPFWVRAARAALAKYEKGGVT